MDRFPMLPRLFSALLLVALGGMPGSCESLYDAATEEIFGSGR